MSSAAGGGGGAHQPPAAALTEQQLASLAGNGFLVLPKLFNPTVISPLIAEIEGFLQHKTAELVSTGRLSAASAQGFSSQRFDYKAASLCAALGEPPAHMPSPLTEVQSKSHVTAGMFALMTDPSILDVVPCPRNKPRSVRLYPLEIGEYGSDLPLKICHGPR
jgi:hypothetical protein